MIKVKISSAQGQFNKRAGGKTKYFDDLITAVREAFTYQQAQDIAEGAVNAMRKKLNDNITREGSTGKLANSLSVKLSQNQYGYQFHIGDISAMPEYWYVINYGERYGGGLFIPPKRLGSFEGNPSWPQAGEGGQFWMQGQSDMFGAKYLMNPQKPVEGKHYIEAGERYINNRLARLADRRFKSFSRKATKTPNPTIGEES